MPDAEVARHASRVTNRTLRSLGYKPANPAMTRDAAEPDDDEDSDDYESRQVEKICSFVRDNLSSKSMKTLIKMLDAHRELKGQEEASGIAGDDPTPFKGRPEPGGTMTGDAAYDSFIRRFPDARRIGVDDGYGRQPPPPVPSSGSEEDFYSRYPEARRLG